MSAKSSTLCIATKSPGVCRGCRHANQETVDFAEGRVFCGYAKTLKAPDRTCDVTLPLPTSPRTPVTQFTRYYLYEPYTGDNGTYGVAEDLRILAEDADEALRRSLNADRAVIPGSER